MNVVYIHTDIYQILFEAIIASDPLLHQKIHKNGPIKLIVLYYTVLC